MEHTRFDAIAVAVGSATSRRQLLKAALGGAVAAVVGGSRVRLAAAQDTAVRPPNFAFLVPLPTDPDLEKFGLNQTITGPPTIYRSAKAMATLPKELSSILGKHMKSSY